MTKLPVCSGEDAIRALKKAGWIQDRQRGSHVTLFHEGMTVVLTVPLHRELGPGILRSIIRKAGLTVKEFQEFLE